MKVGSVFVYRIATGVSRLYFLTRGGLRPSGQEHIPRSKGVIVCSIHLSNLDPPALACTMPGRRLLALGKEELWRNRLFGWLITQIGAFPIRRGEGDKEAIRYSLQLLEAGHALLVFPEGTRGDGVSLGPIAAGPAMLARKTGLPVLPVGIVGTQPGGRGAVQVRYGPTFTWSDHPDRERFAAHLAQEIRRLCAEGGLKLR